MKVRSGHIVFDRKVKYKDLVPAFRAFFLRFLEETGQLPEDREAVAVLLEENFRYLRLNRKPEGYNRDGPMRLIFPLTDRVECYVYGRAPSVDVVRVTEVLSRVLQKHRLKHTVEWDRLLLFAERKRS
jgi:hypothetical protein